MRHFFLSVLGGVILGLLIFSGSVLVFRQVFSVLTPQNLSLSEPLPQTPIPSSSHATEQHVLLFSFAAKNDGPRVFDITQRGATALLLPADILPVSTPVFTGTEGIGIRKGTEKTSSASGNEQVVSWPMRGGKETLVSDSTLLVKPRGMFASPRATTFAFYLDDTDGTHTELWTYNADTHAKRVAVERLSRNVQGPFWSADGGFLLLDGTRILRGSPDRSGEDTLPVLFPANDILAQGNALIASPGGTQVIYASRTTRETISHVRVIDIAKQTTREIGTLPSAAVSFLGWTQDGALLAAAGTDSVNIARFTKKGQDTLLLPDATIMSPLLSGDGTLLAYLTQGARETTVVVYNLSTQTVQWRHAIPSEAIPVPSKNADTPSYQLAQFLELPAKGPSPKPAPATAASSSPLAEQAIVTYVMDHIREIAEAPTGEPVSAERVWFTKTPDVVFVDYRVGTDLWRRLVHITLVANKPDRHDIVGVFAPKEGDWVLTRGTTLPDTTSPALYEYDPDISRWVQKTNAPSVQP